MARTQRRRETDSRHLQPRQPRAFATHGRTHDWWRTRKRGANAENGRSMNVTPRQRAQLEGYLKQVAVWRKSLLGENAERFVVGNRIMGVPCSALALEALTDFIYPECPVGDNDYTDANH